MISLLFALSVLLVEAICFGMAFAKLIERCAFGKPLCMSGARMVYVIILGYILISGIA